jgi:hypothetical protein
LNDICSRYSGENDSGTSEICINASVGIRMPQGEKNMLRGLGFVFYILAMLNAILGVVISAGPDGTVVDFLIGIGGLLVSLFFGAMCIAAADIIEVLRSMEAGVRAEHETAQGEIR